MDSAWQLVADNHSVGGRVVTSLIIIALGITLSWAVGAVVSRKTADRYRRYYLRKFVRAVIVVVVVVALAIVWHAFAGRLAVVFGLMAAGLAFAMQEVIGALAGWFNIVSGRVFRVGDRIEMGGVRGDVLDITPLRTKIMEIGSPEDETWVHGRQFTGRVVALSNKSTFTEPVFNYSTLFEFIWEELTVPVPYDADWDLAKRILLEEVERHASARDAAAAMQRVIRRFPIDRAEVDARVFVGMTTSGAELSARFVVPVRTARATKDEITRSVLRRFDEHGLRVRQCHDRGHRPLDRPWRGAGLPPGRAPAALLLTPASASPERVGLAV